MTMKNDLQKMNLAGDVEKITETTYNIFSDEDETKFERDEEPSLVAEIVFTNDGNIESQRIAMPQSGDEITTDYIYENGLKTEERSSLPDGRLEQTVVEYAENQLPVSETTKRNGVDMVKTTFIYNDDDRLAEIASLYTNGTHVQRFITYNEQGNKQEERTVEKSEFTSEERTVYAYNEHNELVESTYYDYEGNVVITNQYEYTDFDALGNWTAKTELMDHVPIRTIERTIQYRS